MTPFLQVPTLPPPPADYGYLVSLLVGIAAISYTAIGAIAVLYVKYRDKQEERADKRAAEDKAERESESKQRAAHHDAQWQQAEAARVAARGELKGEMREEFASIRGEIKDFGSVVADETKALRGENALLRERLHGLELQFEQWKQQPPKEGGKR